MAFVDSMGAHRNACATNGGCGGFLFQSSRLSPSRKTGHCLVGVVDVFPKSTGRIESLRFANSLRWCEAADAESTPITLAAGKHLRGSKHWPRSAGFD
ncbi:hypothetical protein RBSH_04665 [Rhodopirellula baltica SH28]|uniref:Uncharacterized protein n=1 Tax=Rhodopirellula baltica SH28 TaxID=993517 RepID=K5C9V6_RHOBT|nr:hypothetical protein RBSH_04665 [Rhodopirellula baltica SH28]